MMSLSDSSQDSYDEIDLDTHGRPSLPFQSTQGPAKPIQVLPPLPPTVGPGDSSKVGRVRAIQNTIFPTDSWKGVEPPPLPPLHPGRNTDPPPLPPPNRTRAKFPRQQSLPTPSPTTPPHTTGPAHPPGHTFKPKRPAPGPPTKPKRSQTFCAQSNAGPAVATTNGEHAPPIPPKPVQRSVSFTETDNLARKRSNSEQDFMLVSDELSLPEFVKRYKNEFPVRVRVCKGFYGATNRTSVSEGDMFNIHFLKNTKVAVVDDGYGTEFKIALNSAIEFGILYNPNRNKQEAKNGFTFEKASDIMALKTLPKVLRSLTAFKGNSPESSVEENELLIVTGVKSKLKGKVLKVYSPHLRKKKYLFESCSGNFSTKPYDVRLYLPEIAGHLVNPFPLQVMLYVNPETAGDIPSALLNDSVHMRKMEVDASLVATPFFFDSEEESVDIVTELIDVPFDLDIEVQIMESKHEEDTDQLYLDTREIFEQFDPTRLCPYLSAPSTVAYNAQAAFYNAVHEGNKLAGVNLEAPPGIYVNLPQQHPPPTSPPATPPSQLSPQRIRLPSSQTSNTCDDVTSSELSELQNKMGELGKKVESLTGGISLKSIQSISNMELEVKRISREVLSARADSMRIEGRMVKAVEEVMAVKKELAKIGPVVASLQSAFQEIQALQRGRSNVPVATPSTATPTIIAGDAKTVESNKQYLATLDCMQIVQLLDMMGMKQYYDSFMEERITGAVLLECDDQILEVELKVKSKLHRVRLVQIIKGRHSAESILRGEDPYVYATKATSHPSSTV